MAFSLNQRFLLSSSLLLLILALSVSSSSSSSTFLSDAVFGSQAHTGRNLLQAKKGCSVNFEFLNYTIITSKCKGPSYPPKDCCGAFKEFACPYVDVLNDLTNDCASTMFSYINLYGKYPPGLFAHECREGKEGLACPALPPSALADDTSSQVVHFPSLVLVLTACFLILLF
ncbi:GPI-anchored protein LLG1 [Lotus japonicus]|uniref:GPI-anchored protein LLG1-like domain-containing protein n=1 Tax=Lotus japonicus TaxID=34305 RepID=I3SAU8_LOTJA|nr:GPI-anchored protein LLG1 [Lotus japonicus]AFK37390.1 unknown [Lotus japonicus]